MKSLRILIIFKQLSFHSTHQKDSNLVDGFQTNVAVEYSNTMKNKAHFS
jgi:hypothetical protein